MIVSVPMPSLPSQRFPYRLPGRQLKCIPHSCLPPHPPRRRRQNLHRSIPSPPANPGACVHLAPLPHLLPSWSCGYHPLCLRSPPGPSAGARPARAFAAAAHPTSPPEGPRPCQLLHRHRHLRPLPCLFPPCRQIRRLQAADFSPHAPSPGRSVPAPPASRQIAPTSRAPPPFLPSRPPSYHRSGRAPPPVAFGVLPPRPLGVRREAGCSLSLGRTSRGSSGKSRKSAVGRRNRGRICSVAGVGGRRT
mmetsp:Transcript_2382/g.5143  ORF Transcript_2382/g.5143 Transcript_2382/m.5143 type:complete len:248 (+) Transcript_2382:557-1300(+)